MLQYARVKYELQSWHLGLPPHTSLGIIEYELFLEEDHNRTNCNRLAFENKGYRLLQNVDLGSFGPKISTQA